MVLKKKVEAGIFPQLFYFNENKELIVTDTAFGKIAVENWTTGGPNSKGIHVDNNINISVKFNNEKNINEAIEILRYLMVFFDIISGRKQSVLGFNAIVNGYCFDVYLCDEQRGQLKHTKNTSQLFRLPIQATDKPDELMMGMATAKFFSYTQSQKDSIALITFEKVEINIFSKDETWKLKPCEKSDIKQY